MGYIIALLLLLLVVPLVFMMLSRRTTAAGGVERRRSRGMTVAQPSSDQPEPRSDSGVNEPKPGVERRLPPG